MAAADTARLIASLELDSRKFQSGMNKATGSLGKIEKRLGAFSGFVNRNVGRALDSAVSTGIRALVGGVQGGIESLAQLEDATTAVSGAIKQTGMTGQVTAAQIAQWANEIEAATDAAFDDKDITRNAATLIRYGKVTTANLRPALEVMTDLAVKTGSVDSAASLLAKALADPAKAAGKLTRSGVILTKQQQDQIKALVKAGKLGKAQAIILQAIGTATKNAAKDSKGAFGDMQNTLADTKEDAERLLGEAAFPVLQRLGTKFKEALADPRTMSALKTLGQQGAQALDKVIDAAEKVPWGTIADGLGKAAGFAKNLFDAFASMPPEVQATIIALAGLNKLSGGAVTGIVGELGKGLIKGVLGMTAGVVNINAGVVKGGGVPIPGGAGASAAGAAGAAAIGLTAATISALAVGLGAAVVGGFVTSGIIDKKGGLGPALKPVNDAGQTLGPNLRVNDVNITGQRVIASGKGGSLIINDVPIGKLLNEGQSLQDFRSGERQSWTEPLKAIGTKQDEARSTFEGSMAAVERTTGTGLRGVDSTARSGLSAATSAVNNASANIRGAIAANRPIVTTNVEVNVTATSVQKATTTSTRYGPINGSQGGGTGTGGGGNKYD